MRRGTWWAFEAFLQLAPGQMRCIEDRRWRARGTTKTLLELPPGLTQRSGCLRFGGLFRMKHFVESHDAVPLRFVFGQLRTSQMQTDRVWYGHNTLDVCACAYVGVWVCVYVHVHVHVCVNVHRIRANVRDAPTCTHAWVYPPLELQWEDLGLCTE